MSHSKKLALAAAGAGGAFAAWRLWKRAEVHRRSRAISADTRIVIAGAGFAGMSAAQELSRLLPEENHGVIHLIDRNNFLLFTPMLTEVAGGELDPADVVAPTRRLSQRIDFIQGSIKQIDVANKTVVLEIGHENRELCTVKAAHFVIALGSSPNYHDIPGLREHSLPIMCIDDATRIKNRVLEALELANVEPDVKLRREILTFVVGGGGYTGVETMAAINDLVRTGVKDYQNLSPSEISTIIIEFGDRLLEELSPDLAAFGQQKLEDRGVRVLLRTKITRVGENFVELEDRERIPTRTMIWAGDRAESFDRATRLQTGKARTNRSRPVLRGAGLSRGLGGRRLCGSSQAARFRNIHADRAECDTGEVFWWRATFWHPFWAAAASRSLMYRSANSPWWEDIQR